MNLWGSNSEVEPILVCISWTLTLTSSDFCCCASSLLACGRDLVSWGRSKAFKLDEREEGE